MKLFKNYLPRKSFTDKAASCIANSIIDVQGRFSDKVYSLTYKWKQKQQWIFLYIICVLFGGLSVLAILQPFEVKHAYTAIRFSSIVTPKIIVSDRGKRSITAKEVQEVQAFKLRLDSLIRTEEGKNLLKGLLDKRPGLMDSVQMVEQNYYSQQK